MSGLAAAGLLSAGLGVYKVVKGANQISDANNLAKTNIFQKERIPNEITQATNLAAQNYYNGMPGQSTAQQNINRNSANAFAKGTQGASSGGDLLDLAAKLNYGDSVATNDLASKAAEYKAQALGGYQNALNTQGQWQDKLYNNNTLQPYLRTANTAASMYGAGNQNEFSGLDQIGTAAIAGTQAFNNPDDTTTQQPTPDYSEKNLQANINALPNRTPYANVTPYNNGQIAPYTGWQDFNAAQAMSNAALKKRGY